MVRAKKEKRFEVLHEEAIKMKGASILQDTKTGVHSICLCGRGIRAG